MIAILIVILLSLLVVCAFFACLHKNFLTSVIIFMSYSVIMAVIWMILESPDLAITEAAVGAGVDTVLFFVTLKKIHAMDLQKNENDVEADYDDKTADNQKQ